MSYNTILLKGADLAKGYDEKRAGEAGIYPGFLVKQTSSDTVIKHAVRGGRWDRWIALDNALSGPDGVNTAGNTIDSVIPSGEVVRLHQCIGADEFYGALHAGESVVIGDYLISYGDGTLCKAASTFLANTVAASTALSNTTTETTYSNGSVTIPANTLKVGDVIRVRSQGIATATNSTDTLKTKLYIGSTAIVDTGALDVADNDIWTIDAFIVIRTIGASGTFVAYGTKTIGPQASATVKPFNLGSTAIDTTAANIITAKGTWSVASASNSSRQDVFVVDQVGASSSGSPGGGEIVGQAQIAVDNSAGSTYARVPVLVA